MPVTAVCPVHDTAIPLALASQMGCRCGQAVTCARCDQPADRLVDGEALCEGCAG